MDVLLLLNKSTCQKIAYSCLYLSWRHYRILPFETVRTRLFVRNFVLGVTWYPLGTECEKGLIVNFNQAALRTVLKPETICHQAHKKNNTYGRVITKTCSSDNVYTDPDEFGTVHQFVRFGLAFTRNSRNRTNSSTVSYIIGEPIKPGLVLNRNGFEFVWYRVNTGKWETVLFLQG